MLEVVPHMPLLHEPKFPVVQSWLPLHEVVAVPSGQVAVEVDDVVPQTPAPEQVAVYDVVTLLEPEQE